MPKTNDAIGATYDGYTGVVEHAGGAASTRLGGLSELDPEKNLDGTMVEGDHPDHPDAGKGEGDLKRELDGYLRADANDINPINPPDGNADQAEHPADPAKRSEEEGNTTGKQGGDPESDGTSSKTLSSSKPSSSAKSARAPR